LRTNQPALVQATSFARLVRLVITNDYAYDRCCEWVNVLPTLSALTYLRVENSDYPERLGQAIAQLIQEHHTLTTIHFSFQREMGNRMIHTILSSSAPGSLSSLRALLGAPLDTWFVSVIIRQLPLLTIYSGWAAKPHWIERPCGNDSPGIASLTLNEYHSHTNHYIISRLSHLTELTLCSAVKGDKELVGPYVKLRRLRLPSGYIENATRDVDEIAPCLEQLSIGESMSWLVSHRSSCLMSLSSSTRLQHVILRRSTIDNRPTDANELTRLVISHMVRSKCWRQVTCAIMPVTFYLSRDIAPGILSLVRWHLLKESNAIESYRPRIYVIRWRMWIPGLPAHRIDWERV
jgi:hypothetical protein